MPVDELIDGPPPEQGARRRSRAPGVLLALVVVAVGLPALLLTATRLVSVLTDTAVGTVIRLQSFAPVAIPAYLLLVLLLLRPAVRARARRAAWRVGLVAAVAGLALHVSWWSPQVLGTTPGPKPGAEHLVVMTSNMLAGEADTDVLVATLEEYDVDLLVAEEITQPALDAMDAAGLTTLLPHRVGEPAPGGEVDGTMIFSRLPLGEAQRIATRFGSYLVEAGDYTVLGVHPLAPVTGQGEGWRSEHAVIRAAAVAADADLILGDFNATDDHAPLRELDDAGFTDAAELVNAGWQPTWPASHLGIIPFLPPVVAIDHVMLGRRMTALDTRTVVLGGTDHESLIATVALRQ